MLLLLGKSRLLNEVVEEEGNDNTMKWWYPSPLTLFSTSTKEWHAARTRVGSTGATSISVKPNAAPSLVLLLLAFLIKTSP